TRQRTIAPFTGETRFAPFSGRAVLKNVSTWPNGAGAKLVGRTLPTVIVEAWAMPAAINAEAIAAIAATSTLAVLGRLSLSPLPSIPECSRRTLTVPPRGCGPRSPRGSPRLWCLIAAKHGARRELRLPPLSAWLGGRDMDGREEVRYRLATTKLLS